MTNQKHNFKTKLPSISEIEELTLKSSPYFFVPKTLRFFGQQMNSFHVERLTEDTFEISAPMIDTNGKHMGTTKRIFNALTNELENV